LHDYGSKTNFKDLKVILKDGKGKRSMFSWEERGKTLTPNLCYESK